jgi:glycosyltransferase involved in cell wall biosynthesis
MVSVIIIFLNAGKFIREAIDSVFAQTHRDWELLLVDDGSTDASTAIAHEYVARHPDRVRYFEHPGHVNRGMSATRNLGIRHARGAFIALLDADDLWLPMKLERQLALFARHPEVGMVYGAPEEWGEWETGPEVIPEQVPLESKVPIDRVFAPPELATLVYPLGTAKAPASCDLMLRRQAVERAGGFEETFRGFYEDQAFLAKVYLREHVYVSSECWLRVRVHPDSCCAATFRSGRYHETRRYFLNWLGLYLHDQHVRDADVWNAYGIALEASGRQLHESTWSLRVAADNVASLAFLPDSPEVVRIAIDRASTGVTHDIQLNRVRLATVANRRYSAEFAVRADAPRTLAIGVADARAPWSGLGLYQTVSLTTTWQRHSAEFTATADADEARIHFDLGGSAVAVEVSAVRLHPLDGLREASAP